MVGNIVYDMNALFGDKAKLALDVMDAQDFDVVLMDCKRPINQIYRTGLKSPKMVSTYNKVDTYYGEEESLIAIISIRAS